VIAHGSPNAVVLVLVAAIAAAGVVGSALVARMARRKSKPENESIIVNTSSLLVGLAREEITRIDHEKDRLENRIDEIQHEFEKQIHEFKVERAELLKRLEEERRAKEELAARVKALEEENVFLREELDHLKESNGGTPVT
jgi:chromosome segregation ATPase